MEKKRVIVVHITRLYKYTPEVSDASTELANNSNTISLTLDIGSDRLTSSIHEELKFLFSIIIFFNIGVVDSDDYGSASMRMV